MTKLCRLNRGPERIVQGMNRPGYESSWERNVQGTKRPKNESSIYRRFVSSIYRRFVPGNETSWERNVYRSPLFWTDSMISMSLTLYGNHVVTPYSRCDLTSALQSRLKHFISRHVKVLLITAVIPLAFLETICICSTKVSPLSIIIPKSFSRLVHSIFTALPSQSDTV